MFDGHITLDLNQNQSRKNIFLLYNGVTEQYHDQKILEKIKALSTDQILQLTNENDTIKSLLVWFKNDFMSWTFSDRSFLCDRLPSFHYSTTRLTTYSRKVPLILLDKPSLPQLLLQLLRLES